MTYGELYQKFCEAEPDMAKHICDYRPWGSTSIVIWLDGGSAYKVKDVGGKFVKQSVSADDIRRKYGL